MINAMADVARWADKDGDEDGWEGFYLSLDLLDDTAEDGAA